jgi:hypothetical protein
MNNISSDDQTQLEEVPDQVLPHGQLGPALYRDLPPAISWKKMVGPSIMLAGLSLGSGEFILWPHLVYSTGFIFFWACMLGVITQYFLNLEIERYTLATGESAITGFCRLNKNWAWVMLILNIIPWAWPGWATGAGTIISWLIYGPTEVVQPDGSVAFAAQHVSFFGILGLLIVGIVLTAGPVVYNTVEKIQFFLVLFIIVVVILLSLLVVRGDAVVRMAEGIASVGQMPDMENTGISMMVLLGALAFAGAGGTTNLGQSNFIKDKGYGMGKYIGRITSPLTGQEESTSEVGYFFKMTDANLSKWKDWWRASNIEHFFSFFCTCILCLCLMSLISYSLFYNEEGILKPGMEKFGDGMNFIWGQANILGSLKFGTFLKFGFLIMGIAILLTTELGVLDVVARISTDIVKVNYLKNNQFWTLSKLYFCFLWGEILLGIIILSIPTFDKPLFLIRTAAAMNGAVMFLYSFILLYLNKKVLSKQISMGWLQTIMVIWSALFFGYFTVKAFQLEIVPYVRSLF